MFLDRENFNSFSWKIGSHWPERAESDRIASFEVLGEGGDYVDDDDDDDTECLWSVYVPNVVLSAFT